MRRHSPPIFPGELRHGGRGLAGEAGGHLVVQPHEEQVGAEGGQVVEEVEGGVGGGGGGGDGRGGEGAELLAIALCYSLNGGQVSDRLPVL